MAPKNTPRFAGIVEQAANESGLTQAQIAERGGPTDTTLRKIIQAQPVGLSPVTLRKLETAFDWVIMPDFMVAALERQRERNLPSELGLVFPGRDGGPRTTANTRRQFRDAREHVVKDKVTGVPDGPQDMFAWVSPKTFRKTVATLLADEGGVEVAADQLGHTSPEITRKHYWHKQRSGPDVRHILNKLAPVSGGFKVGEQGNAPSPEAGKGA